MAFRTIMIFPGFENMEIIDRIRAKFDPLYGLVRPHITLVFPFEDEMSNDVLKLRLNDALAGMAPFNLILHGTAKQADPYGNYLFLNVEKGAEKLQSLREKLYKSLWGTDGIPGYVPHMTLGKLPTREEMDRAFSAIVDLPAVFHTCVDKISVEMIGANEESIIILEEKLQ